MSIGIGMVVIIIGMCFLVHQENLCKQLKGNPGPDASLIASIKRTGQIGGVFVVAGIGGCTFGGIIEEKQDRERWEQQRVEREASDPNQYIRTEYSKYMKDEFGNCFLIWSISGADTMTVPCEKSPFRD